MESYKDAVDNGSAIPRYGFLEVWQGGMARQKPIPHKARLLYTIPTIPFSI